MLCQKDSHGKTDISGPRYCDLHIGFLLFYAFLQFFKVLIQRKPRKMRLFFK